MKTTTWPYGTIKEGEVLQVVPGREPQFPKVCICDAEGESQAFIMIGVRHCVSPAIGLRVKMRFEEGGPTGGYWRIVE
jgi:hypothetical protein